jgi:hypothetical protein
MENDYPNSEEMIESIKKKMKNKVKRVVSIPLLPYVRNQSSSIAQTN